MSKLVLLFTTAVLLTTGCKKKDAASGGGGGGSAAAAEKTADKPDKPAAATCPADATKNDEAGFCIKLPAAYGKQLREPQKMGSVTMYEYNKDVNSYGVSLRVSDFQSDGSFKMDLDAKKQMLEVPAHKDLKTGDIANGGKFWRYQDDDGIWVTAVAHGAKKQVECTTRQSPTTNDPDKDALLDACTSLVVTQ